jgi:hypothetical protein
VHESPLPIEPAFQEDAVQVGIEPYEVSRRGVGDDGGQVPHEISVVQEND